MVTETSKTPHCPKCDSTDVLFDAFAAWNPQTKQYEMTTVFEHTMICQACGKEADPQWE